MSLEKLKFIHHLCTISLLFPCFLALVYCYCIFTPDIIGTRKFQRNLIGPILPALISFLYKKCTYFIVKGKLKILIVSFWVKGLSGTLTRVPYMLEAHNLLVLIYLICLFVIYFCWVLCKLDRRWFFIYIFLNLSVYGILRLFPYGFF